MFNGVVTIGNLPTVARLLNDALHGKQYIITQQNLTEDWGISKVKESFYGLTWQTYYDEQEEYWYGEIMIKSDGGVLGIHVKEYCKDYPVVVIDDKQIKILLLMPYNHVMQFLIEVQND